MTLISLATSPVFHRLIGYLSKPFIGFRLTTIKQIGRFLSILIFGPKRAIFVDRIKKLVVEKRDGMVDNLHL